MWGKVKYAETLFYFLKHGAGAMRRETSGQYMEVSTFSVKTKAFVPDPLPPVPPIEWSQKLRDTFDRALLELGRLDSVSTLLPDPSLFLYMYIRKEAVLSSRIEGTQSSISDLLLFEMDEEPGVPLDDVREVSNYVDALYYGIKRMREDLPLSLRLLREIHQVLLAKGRGSESKPGDFRRVQNWIGGSSPGAASFAPPPRNRVLQCMGELERFIHSGESGIPVLAKAALAHAQFETIHPFEDGNGRLGRMLIILILFSEKVLEEPLLYLSLYFKQHRQRYYELLNRTRSDGDWESWLQFFGEATIETASRAVGAARSLIRIAAEDVERIDGLGRSALAIHRIHQVLKERPIAPADLLARRANISQATVYKHLERMKELGIVREITGMKRNRVYAYHRYIEILKEGTEGD